METPNHLSLNPVKVKVKEKLKKKANAMGMEGKVEPSDWVKKKMRLPSRGYKNPFEERQSLDSSPKNSEHLGKRPFK